MAVLVIAGSYTKISTGQAANILAVIFNIHSTEFLLSTFEFERQNIAGCCKQTFCVQFSKCKSKT